MLCNTGSEKYGIGLKGIYLQVCPVLHSIHKKYSVQIDEIMYKRKQLEKILNVVLEAPKEPITIKMDIR